MATVLAVVMATTATACCGGTHDVIAPDVWADLHASPNATVNVLVSFVGGTTKALADAIAVDLHDLHLASSNSRVRQHLVKSTAKSQAIVQSLLRGDSAHPRRRLSVNDEAAEAFSSPEICPGLDDLRVREIYLTNQLHVRRLTLCMAEQLALRSEVASIRYGATLVLDTTTPPSSHVTDVSTTPWNVRAVDATPLWTANITGQGIVVGVIDSGVRSTHDSLRSNFRQNYGWFDAVELAPYPVDAYGHGSHVVGIAISVAPSAQWIACRACSSGGGCHESDLLLCMQFMLCPTDSKGEHADCSKAPRVVNNSWGSGIANWPNYKAAVQAWREAGIVPVFSGGNAGASGCMSVKSPADYDNVIAVGSVDATNALSAFSSRGPTVTSGTTKPDVVAPGVAIRSASSQADNQTVEMSGTSMAAPHVTGAIALLLSGNPALSYDQLYKALTQGTSTSPVKTTDECRRPQDEGASNNNLSGYGLVDVARAGRVLGLESNRPGCGGILYAGLLV